MVAQYDKRLLWHPRGQNKFVVGGNTQITLYEWLPDSSEIKQVASQLELNQMKCFAWSPDPILDDLVAVGFSNGRVDLLRFDASKHARNSPVVSLPPRNARACNALAFSHNNPNHLAVGLDKVRNDPSLVVWDVHSALPALSLVVKSPQDSMVPPVSPSRIDNARTQTIADWRVIGQHASTEIVSTLAWLPHNPHLLLAGISHRWLQLFDLRSSASSPAKAASKVHGIATDPYDPHHVACFSEGVVSLWDIRRFSQPVLTFTSKDASADGADSILIPQANSRAKGTPPASNLVASLAHVEFSPSRRGTLATLERDATYVRFWDIRQAQFAEVRSEPPRSRESSQSGGKAVKTSWVKPWAASGPASNHPSPPPATPREPPSHNLILADTRRTKTFPRPFTSFAFVPSGKPHPLTSNVMLVNKDGDLELYAVHDTPVHPPWSSRGDLALGIGCSYAIVPGITDPTPPREPWELLATHPSRSGSLERRPFGDEASRDSPTFYMAPATFGRGDEDGFPALSPVGAPSTDGASPARRRSRMMAPESVTVGKDFLFEHTAVGRDFSRKRSRVRPLVHEGDVVTTLGHAATPKTVTIALAQGEGQVKQARKSPALSALQHIVENDISMLMRRRAALAYGLLDPVYNSSIVQNITPNYLNVAELWLWVHHSQRLIFSPSSIIDGYNFAYQGLSGIWEGFRPTRTSPPSGQPTPRLPTRSTLLEAPISSPRLAPISLEGPPRSSSKRSSDRKRNPATTLLLPEDFLTAIGELNLRNWGVDSVAAWKPSVATTKLSQRRFALQLCGWSLAQDDLTRAIRRWEKENRHSQAACWLVFTEQHQQATEILLRSKDESHHVMSGMLAALTSSTARTPELIQHCERLIVKLQDPYLRALLTHLTVRDWTEVLQEESLPLRERLAIALQFLDDKEVSSYLRRIADRAIHDGDIHGLFVTGITSAGMDLLQAYVDSTGDVQTAALLAALPPALARDTRAARWMNAYKDLLDGWRLFHHRCQLDIERGRILKDAVESAEMQPFDWAPKQVLLRCNYCSKPLDPPFPADGNPRATLCPHCGRPLPRCSVCLMTLSLIPEGARGSASSVLTSIPSDTIHGALVFCQTCRHGGHASHILEWFYGEGGAATRAHGTCPIAGCECRCADEM